jgi:hypothetical protein
VVDVTKMFYVINHFTPERHTCHGIMTPVFSYIPKSTYYIARVVVAISQSDRSMQNLFVVVSSVSQSTLATSSVFTPTS